MLPLIAAMDPPVFLPALPILVLHTATLGGLQGLLYLVLCRALACGWPTSAPLAGLARLAVAVLAVQGVWLLLTVAIERGTPPPVGVLWAGPVVFGAIVAGGNLLVRRDGWALVMADPAMARRVGIATARHGQGLALVALLLVLLVAVLKAALPSAMGLPAVSLAPLAAVLLLGPVLAVIVAGAAVAADGLMALALPETPPGLVGALLVSFAALGSAARAMRRDARS
jgi:hypothetical protein